MDTDFNQHPNRYTFSKKITNSNENFNFRKKITKKEHMFATQVMTGQPAVDAVKNVYGTQDFKKAKSKAGFAISWFEAVHPKEIIPDLAFNPANNI